MSHEGRVSHRSAAGVGGKDHAVVAGQLGRVPQPMSRVMARCSFGYPAVVENLPYDGDGRPFPTLYYCTCPTLVAAVARRESAGEVTAWTRRLAGDEDLRAAVAAATAATRRRRRLLARRCAAGQLDGGASLTTGIGGVRDPGAIKCLHAHVAHALAHPGYRLGEAVLDELDEPWCRDRRCAAWLPGAA